MATSDNSLLVTFNCFACNAIPSDEQVNKCSNGHSICLKCSAAKRCKCRSVNLVKIPNPLLQIVQTTIKKECIYKDQGCTWMVSDIDNMQTHCNECKFRPYKCVGAEWGFWKCGWAGIQQNLGDHLKESHLMNGEFFPYWHSGTVDFDPKRTCAKFNLIDAFNKKFVFLYKSHEKETNVMFIIYLMGRKSDAKKFMIDFELKDDFRKIKFIEMCYSDADDIKKIINEHRCFVIPKKLVESYAENGRLPFRFVVKKTDAIELENVGKQQHLQNNMHGDGENQTQRQQKQQQQFKKKPLMKASQSESNLTLTAHNGNCNNKGHRRPKYRRTPKN